MSEVSHGNLKMLKLFTGFIDYQYLIDRGDNSLECFNRATNYYGLWQPVPVRYRTRETRLLSLLRLIGVIMKDEDCMFCVCLNGDF